MPTQNILNLLVDDTDPSIKSPETDNILQFKGTHQIKGLDQISEGPT